MYYIRRMLRTCYAHVKGAATPRLGLLDLEPPLSASAGPACADRLDGRRLRCRPHDESGRGTGFDTVLACCPTGKGKSVTPGGPGGVEAFLGCGSQHPRRRADHARANYRSTQVQRRASARWPRWQRRGRCLYLTSRPHLLRCRCPPWRALPHDNFVNCGKGDAGVPLVCDLELTAPTRVPNSADAPPRVPEIHKLTNVTKRWRTPPYLDLRLTLTDQTVIIEPLVGKPTPGRRGLEARPG